MLETQTISPFSLEGHTWDLKWTILRSNVKYRTYETLESEREIEMLRAISSLGLIGTRQLRRIFFPTQNKRLVQMKLKNMVKSKKLIRHEIIRDGEEEKAIPVYTLGPAAAPAIGIQYDENYWLRYKTEDVLKKLVFFQFYSYFNQTHPSKVLPAPDPYTGMVEANHVYFVYVVRGDITDILFTLKHNPPGERLIIIAESLIHLKPLQMFLGGGIKVRVITDMDLRDPVRNLAKFKEERTKAI
ncbi:hypothetical protein [Thermicanus aegyptius]|uniref:hypothetical protein n=1 Tax=Thermicanus aegyptius TaxID=94009 RepID=UPI000412EFA4|nr:hypothetical protein [Thermicanus aegyptius]